MDRREGPQAGGLMLAGTAGAVLLMLHHPTSLKGADDGLLLGDWSNAAVHGGMVVCLLAVAVGAASVPRRLGEDHLSVRAGRLGFNGGVGALVVAALVNGFATGRTPGADLPTLFALNQTFAIFGMAMVAGGMALWSPRMLRGGPASKAAGGVGLAAAVLAAGWMIHGGGFGLIPAVVATLVFAAWSGLTATALVRGGPGASG